MGEGKLVYLSFTLFVFPPEMLIFDRANSRMVPYICELLVSNTVLCSVFAADKNAEKEFLVVKTANSFCLHKLLGTEDFFSPYTSDFT